MPKRIRNIQILFRVTEAERALIEQKMALMGTRKMAVYLRRMALMGYVIKLDLPELKEMISLLRRMSNNMNQLAKRANETGRLYEIDLKEVQQQQEMLWRGLHDLMIRLASIR